MRLDQVISQLKYSLESKRLPVHAIVFKTKYDADCLMSLIADELKLDFISNNEVYLGRMWNGIRIEHLTEKSKVDEGIKNIADCCGNCKFFAANRVQVYQREWRAGGNHGSCRVNPPAADRKSHAAIWPYVEHLDWCGRFEKRPRNEPCAL